MKEIWCDIKDYEGLYQVSNHGRVRSLDRLVPFTCRKTRETVFIHKKGRIIAQLIWGGYYTVCLYKKKKQCKRLKVSRLVAQAFIPNRLNKPFVNHIDGDKLNNYVENLEWVTCSENNKHAYDTGLHIPYQNKKIVCIETGQVFDSATQAAKAVGVHKSNICKAAQNAICCSRGKSSIKRTAGGYKWKYQE